MTIPMLAAVLDPPAPEKAFLVSETDLSDKLEFQFNPATLNIKRSVSWSGSSIETSGAYKALSYGGSSYDELSVKFILDTSIPEDPFGLKAAATQAALMVPGATPGKLMDILLKSDPDSVLDTIDKLVEWTFPVMEGLPSTIAEGEVGSLARPRAVTFIWGEKIKFYGAISSLSFDLTLFDSDGTPVRADGTISLVGRRKGPTGADLTHLHELFHLKADKKKAPKKSDAKASETEDTSFF